MIIYAKHNTPGIKQRKVENGEVKSTIYEPAFTLGKWNYEKHYMDVVKIKDLITKVYLSRFSDFEPNSIVIDERGNEHYILKKEAENIYNDENTPDDSVVYVVVEKMPEFPGGMNGLKSYLKKNLRYPDVKKNENKNEVAL